MIRRSQYLRTFFGVVTRGRSYLNLLYLLLSFPLSLFAGALTVTLIAVTIGFVAAPLLYNRPWTTVPVWLGLEVPANAYAGPWMAFGLGSWHWLIDTLSEALVVCGMGVLLGFISLHIVNGMAWLLSRLARAMVRPGTRRRRKYTITR